MSNFNYRNEWASEYLSVTSTDIQHNWVQCTSHLTTHLNVCQPSAHNSIITINVTAARSCHATAAQTGHWLIQAAHITAALLRLRQPHKTRSLNHLLLAHCRQTALRVHFNVDKNGLIEHGFTSAPTQYRLYGRRFLQVWWPNQQCQSTEGGG